MENSTKKQPNSKFESEAETETLDYGEVTAQFACLTPDVFALTLDVIPAIASALAWPKLAGEFLADVIRMLAGRTCAVSLAHKMFAPRLWPESTKAGSARKLSRVFNALDLAQSLSGFVAVRLKAGTKYRVGGADTWTDSAYQMGDFSDVMSEIQRGAIKVDIGRFEGIERRARLLTIVRSVLSARGYQRVPPRARKSQKVATVSEAVGADEPKMKGRVTLDDVNRRVAYGLEVLFEAGIDWANLGLSLPFSRGTSNGDARCLRNRFLSITHLQ